MTTESKEGRLARWSRLKQEENTVLPAAAAEGGALVDGDGATPGEPAEKDVPEIRAEDLPDIDSLDENSDFTPFLQKGVPEELSRLALRKLWKSNPVFANLDGLNDYDDDFSIIETINAAVDTAYKVGKGFLAEEDETEEVGDEEEGVEEGTSGAPEVTDDAPVSLENKVADDLSTDEDASDAQTKETSTSYTSS